MRRADTYDRLAELAECPGANAAMLAGLARSAEGMLVVADHRYSDSVIFARALGIRGAGIFSVKAGCADVWFDALAHGWRLAAASWRDSRSSPSCSCSNGWRKAAGCAPAMSAGMTGAPAQARNTYCVA